MTSNDTEQTTRSPYSAYLGSPDTHIGATQPIALRKGLLDGISVAQIIAAAAAAVTSMLLSSKIGIAGSVIGAAVSSVVTVVCSQLYRNALDTSARKLKAKQAMRAYQAQERVLDTLDAYGTSAASSTTNMSPEAAHEDTRTPHIRIAPTKLQARAAAERSASKRKVTFASILIAVLAVVISAGAVMLATAGEGLGTKTPSVFGASTSTDQPPTNPADEVAPTTPSTSAPQATQDGNDTTNGSATSSTDATSGSGSTSGTGSTGTGDSSNYNTNSGGSTSSDSSDGNTDGSSSDSSNGAGTQSTDNGTEVNAGA